MDVAQLVLDYLKALAWPLIVGFAVYHFREPIRDKISSLENAKTPLGEASFYRDVHSVEERAGEIAEQLAAKDEPASVNLNGGTPSVAGSSSSVSPPATMTPIAPESAWLASALGTVLEGYDLSSVRDLVQLDPNAAVIMSLRELEKLTKAVVVISDMEPLQRPLSLQPLLERLRGKLAAEYISIARDLARLRNRVAHGDEDVNASAALSFVHACEPLGEAITSLGQSMARHPSRAVAIQRALGVSQHPVLDPQGTDGSIQ
ncbi:hypothetical protein GHK92_20150 [Nocardioides sp. dk4132]|uniref:hypothetical protein n=1 Tax=unclassified Nocardioides TaxID=2615069 RepID=UPI001294D691|nr:MULTISPECIES: hypothetical protein [unclassified Nocardioides]MQW78183.1 hypothetical protein [Nocardioides sp. dk4132]QGA07152.1 hypothetical protein GFH29_06965 [Nocardioides sp. dk884]